MKRNCTHCGSAIEKHVNPKTIRPFCDSTCYGLWQRGRKFEDQGKQARETLACSVDGCETDHFAKGFCRKHYLQLAYTPPKKPTAHTTSTPHKCARCEVLFIAHHKSPKYCSMACSAADRKKPFIIKKGYRKLLIPNHPRADGKGYVFEHIVVAEAMIGRALIGEEEVHHKDHDKQNNTPDNLLVCANHAEHMRYHARPLCEMEK